MSTTPFEESPPFGSLAPSADLYIPDGTTRHGALSRTTHLGIGAHQDDLEFMAFHGIAECFGHSSGRWFGGVVCTDGGGSSRAGRYADFTDDEMRASRIREQRAAALIGQYSFMAQLGLPSEEIKSPSGSGLTALLELLIAEAHPGVIYTHNLADKHDTHIAVTASVIRAIHRLPSDRRPAKLFGCEVWRDLDWLGDTEKVAFDVSGYDHLAAALNGVFDSQIAGGKRYDLATPGRRAANATFHQSHSTDGATQVCFAMDLSPLIDPDGPAPLDFILAAVDRFREDVRSRVHRFFTAPLP